jgi:serum/glucocorticoid-regulated kinase 2
MSPRVSLNPISKFIDQVLQVRKKDTNRIYAMKVLSKKNILQRREVQHTMSERNILQLTNFPFLVGLKFAFQTPDKLYLVLDFMNGGELFFHLQQAEFFEEDRARFYAAEVLCALEHLHKHGIIYRYVEVVVEKTVIDL